MKNNYYWLNKDSRTFLKRGYLLPDETPEQRFKEIAKKAEEILKIENFAEKFENYLSKGWYSLSSPIISNFGRERGLPISCFGSLISDRLEEIAGTKIAEIAMMTKLGGGTSAYFGDIRGRGAAISSGGESAGTVHFMELYDKLMTTVSQGNVRRGGFAAYLPIDHPDIEEFLSIRDTGHAIQDISIGVCVSDEFMNKIQSGDKHSRKIWGKVIKKRFESGYPYIFFSDNANNQAPQVYKDKNLKINNTNLCVTGDQRVVSSLGLLTAKELFDKNVNLTLFDNKTAVESSPMKRIALDEDVYEITLENGLTHKVTSYHKVQVYKKEDSSFENVECKDLSVGDEVCIQTRRGLFNDQHNTEKAEMLAFYQIYGKDYNFSHHDESLREIQQELFNKYKSEFEGYEEKIPDWLWTSSHFSHVIYSTTFWGNNIDADDDADFVVVSHKSLSLLKELQLIYFNMGYCAEISENRGEIPSMIVHFPGWNYDPVDDVEIDSYPDDEDDKLMEITPKDSLRISSPVKSIKYAGKEDVYCVTVNSDSHLWICNGIVTHNCSEIMLSNDETESFVCDLSSMNLLHYDEWKDTDAVETMVYFLDAVMTEFIDKTENIPHMAAPRKFAINQRALGIGVLGWHSFLQEKRIPFESLEAGRLNNEIWKNIRTKADSATVELAKSLGEPPLLEGYNRRNTTTLAVAPTTSSSFILGQVSPSIEPLNSNYYVKDLAKGKFTFKNPHLEKLLEEKGKNTEEVWLDILVHGGSVQHLDFLSETEKNVFKTFAEISQKEIVIQAAVRQKYIDQGQSLNLMIPADTKPKEVNELMIFAWESGIKSLYYQRGTNTSQTLARSIMTCTSCEG